VFIKLLSVLLFVRRFVYFLLAHLMRINCPKNTHKKGRTYSCVWTASILPQKAFPHNFPASFLESFPNKHGNKCRTRCCNNKSKHRLWKLLIKYMYTSFQNSGYKNIHTHMYIHKRSQNTVITGNDKIKKIHSIK